MVSGGAGFQTAGLAMNFEIEVNGRPRTVKIERMGSRYRIESEGRVDVVDVARVDRTTISMILDADRRSSHEATLLDGREPGEVEVYLRAGVVRTRVAGAPGQTRWSAGGRALGAGGGPERVTAPMPGKIVKVLVAPGDAVAERQGLVVIEAMKMQNELRASRAGQVKDVLVAEGDLVESGRLLAVLE
jgi:biotin carboxyl carrier protein